MAQPAGFAGVSCGEREFIPTSPDYSGIQRAINDAKANGGGSVLLPFGVIQLETGLVSDSSLVTLKGNGRANGLWSVIDPFTGTVFKWIGSAGGTVLKMETTASSATQIVGGGIENLTIDGQNVAAKGVDLASYGHGEFRKVFVRNCTTVGWDTRIITPITDGVEDVQGNVFEQITIRQIESANGIGMRLDGTAPDGNTSFNEFHRVHIYHKNGIGLQLKNTDSNAFFNTAIVRDPVGTAIGVELNGSGSVGVGHSRSNMFYHLDPGLGGLTARATGITQPAINNVVFGYSKENGAPNPVVEGGARLTVFDNEGRTIGVRSDPRRESPFFDDFLGGNAGTGQIGSFGWATSGGTASYLSPVVAGHPGIFRLNVASAGVVAFIRSGAGNDQACLGSEFFDLTYFVRMGDAGTHISARFGLSTAAGTAPPNSGIYMEKALADTSWFGTCRSGGVETRTAALAAVGAATWVRLRVRRVSDTQIGFTVDSGAETLVSTNVPTAAMCIFGHVTTDEAVSHDLDFDAIEGRVGGLSR